MTDSPNRARRNPLLALAGGILALLVAMGIGRFAYTLVLPLMQQEFGFGPRAAGWIASANFLGYFVGSLAATAWPLKRGTRTALLAAFIVSTLTTFGMGVTGSLPVWIALRFVSGVASAWTQDGFFKAVQSGSPGQTALVSAV